MSVFPSMKLEAGSQYTRQKTSNLKEEHKVSKRDEGGVLLLSKKVYNGGAGVDSSKDSDDDAYH